MTTCLETFEKEMFCSFPYRHGDATGKPETRDETRGSSKTRISCETSSNFDTLGTLSNWLECRKMPRLPRKTTWQPAWKPSKRRGFAASLIDTATPQENQRLETRHVGAAKRAFRARPPPILTLSTRNQTVGMSQSATPATQNDMTTCLETFEKERFCSFPHRHGINDATATRRRRDDDATPTRRALEANKGPAPRPPDYKWEPFATHSGKRRLGAGILIRVLTGNPTLLVVSVPGRQNDAFDSNYTGKQFTSMWPPCWASHKKRLCNHRQNRI